jgi:DNA recombination protein RmuC
MGFRTLAIQQRSSEVWDVLGAVKSEFGKFGEVLDKVQKKLHEANNVMETAKRRSRVMQRKLKDVEALPEAQTSELLGIEDAAEGPLFKGAGAGDA